MQCRYRERPRGNLDFAQASARQPTTTRGNGSRADRFESCRQGPDKGANRDNGREISPGRYEIVTRPSTQTGAPATSSRTSASTATQAEIAETRFAEQLRQTRARADRSFAVLMLLQWAGAVLAALVSGPLNGHDARLSAGKLVLVAVAAGGLVTVPPVLLGFLLPGRTVTRYVIATGQMLMSSLLIHLTGGKIETHFHVFGSLAFLAFYLDAPLLLLASVLVGIDNFVRGHWYPHSIYGVDTADPYRWLVHIGWVGFEDFFLIASLRHRLNEMRAVAERQAELEEAGENLSYKAEALAYSEERFRQLAENIEHVFWMTTRPEGALLYISPAYETLWGRTRESLFADPQSSMNAVHADDRETIRASLARVTNGEEAASEARVLRPDGTMRWTLIRAFPIRNSKGDVYRVAGIAEDITDRKEAETERARAFERERRIAAALQTTLLLPPDADAFAGLTVETFYRSALDEAQVGGDFFDAFALGDNKTALVVGDVSGKGLAAAARTAELKYTLRAFLRENADPGDALTRLNHFVESGRHLDEQAFNGFVAMQIAIVDGATGVAEIAVAGAEPPLILRADRTRKVKVVAEGGLPLGVDGDAFFTAVPVRLAPGDTLILATDGLTEARRDGKILDTPGVVALLQSAAEGPDGTTTAPRELGQRLVDAASDWAGGKLQDDLCVLLARRR